MNELIGRWHLLEVAKLLRRASRLRTLLQRSLVKSYEVKGSVTRKY